MDTHEPCSIKGLFQGLVPEAMEIIRGRVTSTSPLQIQAVNDEKLTIHGNIMRLPKHLTDYTTTCDISGGEFDSQTTEDGEHTHATTDSGEHRHPEIQSSGEHTHEPEIEEESGAHTHPAIENSGHHSHGNTEEGGSHSHNLKTFSITGATIKMYNALRVGEIVFILSFNDGKTYYVLDREE